MAKKKTAEETETEPLAGKIAMRSMTGQSRLVGGFVIPAEESLILDLAIFDKRRSDLFDIENEAVSHVMSVRTDDELTPAASIKTYNRD